MEKKRITPSERARKLARKRHASNKPFLKEIYPSLVVGVIAIWSVVIYRFLQAPVPVPPQTQVSPSSSLAPRIRLSDGRHVAYHEFGASRDEAKVQIIVLHDWRHCRLSLLPQLLDEGWAREQRARVVIYDRAGYGQSDPLAGRTPESDADDLAQVADSLVGPGRPFHLLSVGFGSIASWAAMFYIPERLAGVAMVAPANYFWWNGMIEKERDGWSWLDLTDRVTLLITRYFPFLLHAWTKQSILPLGYFGGPLRIPKPHSSDVEILKSERSLAHLTRDVEEALHQGPSESWHRDLKVLCSNWKFDLTEIVAGKHGKLNAPVHIWHGLEDWAFPGPLFQYAKRVLPWIEYHELPTDAHYFYLRDGFFATVLDKLVSNPRDQ